MHMNLRTMLRADKGFRLGAAARASPVERDA